MSIIRRSNGQQIFFNDAVIDNTYSVDILGLNVVEYTDNVAKSLMQKLENYASEVPPESNLFVGNKITPLSGQLWYDTKNNILKVYDERNPTDEKWKVISESRTAFSVSPPSDLGGSIGSETLRWHHLYATHIHVDAARAISDNDGIPALTVNGDIRLSNSNSATGNISKIYADNSRVVIGESQPLSKLHTERIAFSETSNEIGILGTSSGIILPLKNGTYYNKLKLGSSTARFTEWHTEYAFVNTITNVPDQGKTRLGIPPNTTIQLSDKTTLGSADKKYKSVRARTLYLGHLDGNENVFSDSMSSFLYNRGHDLVEEKTSFEEGDKILIRDSDGNTSKASYLDVLPTGMIVPWPHPNSIPNGWYPCMGQTVSNGGTTKVLPNMARAFIKAADSNQRISKNDIMPMSSNSVRTYTGWDGSHDHGGHTVAHPLSASQTRHVHEYKRFNPETITSYDDSDASGSGGNRGTEMGTITRSSSSAGGNSEGKANAHSHDITLQANHRHEYVEDSHDHRISQKDIGRYECIMIMKIGEGYI